MGPRQKKREKERQHSSWPLFAFDRLTPTDDQSDHRHSEPEKKMFSTVFSESRVLPQKKEPFGFTKKSQKSNRKTPNCHKTKMRKKEKKIIKTMSNTTYSHTRSKLHYIHTLIHQNFILKYHPCHQINQSINKIPNSRFLLFSHRCTPTLDFSAYLSPNQDEPGLTRLT